MHRGGDPGKHVLCFHDDRKISICNADRSADQFYRTDPGVWRYYRLLGGIFPDPDGKSFKSFYVSGFICGLTADRRESDLSSCCRRLCGTSGNLGSGSCDSGWKSYGNCGNADLYPFGVCAVYSVP